MSRVVAVIVAGNSLHRFQKKRSKDGLKEEYDMADYVGPGRELDVLLSRLSASCPSVVLLPGAADPANFTLPQQPLHSCLTPSAATFDSFHSTTNPALIPVLPHWDSTSSAPFTLLVSSGQNVSDGLSNVTGMMPVQLMSSLLRWRHLCPSAPDTLPCYPHQTEDPFIVEETPHVLVAGNQPSYDTALVRGEEGQICRVLSLPSFAHSGTAALIDLSSPSLHCEPIQFSIQHRRRLAAAQRGKAGL